MIREEVMVKMEEAAKVPSCDQSNARHSFDSGRILLPFDHHSWRAENANY